MRIFAAGMPKDLPFTLCAKYGLQRLISALNEANYIDSPYPNELPLLIDSGAHTYIAGTQRAGEDIYAYHRNYLQLVARHRAENRYFVELDVYSILSEAFLDEMYEVGFELSGGRYIRVYHPLADNFSYRLLNKWIDQGQTYIGVGGDGLPKAQRMAVLDGLFAITRDKVRIHGFAMVGKDYTMRYPFYSVDSKSVKSARIYGNFSRPVHSLQMIKTSHINTYGLTDYEGLEVSIKAYKHMEQTLTDIWKERGIEWPMNLPKTRNI